MSSFTLPVSGYQVTLNKSLNHKTARALANFEQDHMKWVESTEKLDGDGRPVREVIYVGSLLSQKQDFLVFSFMEKMQTKDGQTITITPSVIDELDYRDGELLYQKVEEAYAALKKK